MSIVKLRGLITTETRLSEIPRTWLELIEPRIVRQGTCWLWQGGVDHTGHPSITYVNPATGKRSTRRVARIVAELFWLITSAHEVLHGCENLNCLNPHHFYISECSWQHEDRPGIIAKRLRNIQDWEKRKP